MKLEPYATSYTVVLNDADFVRLSESEGYRSDRQVDDYLSAKLDNLPGVSKCDYNGHYGAQVFFTLAREDDTPETHRLILETINRHLRELR